jgi:hypothetical protein
MTDLNEFKDKIRKIFDRTPKKIDDNIGSSGNGQILFNEEEPEEAAPEISPPDQSEEQAPEQDAGSTEQPAESPPADGAQNPAPAPVPTINHNQNDAQKLKQMFTDSGDLVYDYSLTNEFNQRLFKFKFTYSGIDINQLMTSNDERTVGALKSELENRLSPEQRFYYVTKWKSLRKKYPEIEKREKNIIIHNTNIMMMVNDDFGEEIPLPEEKKKEAYTNEPDEKYSDVDAVIPDGNDLNKPKKTFPKVAGGDNPMQRMESGDLRAQIRAELMQRLEEAKKHK